MCKGMCVLDHPDFEKIVSKTVLEINLKTVWNAGTFTNMILLSLFSVMCNLA